MMTMINQCKNVYFQERRDARANPRSIPNAIVRSKGDKKTYFGHQLQQCQDHSALHYRLPFEKVRYQITTLGVQICYRLWKHFRVIW